EAAPEGQRRRREDEHGPPAPPKLDPRDREGPACRPAKGQPEKDADGERGVPDGGEIDRDDDGEGAGPEPPPGPGRHQEEAVPVASGPDRKGAVGRGRRDHPPYGLGGRVGGRRRSATVEAEGST